MSKFMMIAGILLAACGIAMGLMIYFSPGKMQILALTPEVAALFLIGGLGLMGVGGAIGAADDSARATRELRQWLAGHEASPLGFAPAAAVVPAVAAVAAAAAVEAVAAVPARVVDVAKTSTADTIAALEKAKADIANALGGPPVVAAKVEEAAPAEAETAGEPEAEGEGEESDLFVVEEKLIRGKPARVLSDGTVEAETEEGWMRFENLEHLEEYLDAMAPQRA